MRVINASVLTKAIKKHAEAAGRLGAWRTEAMEAEWASHQDIRAQYPSASFVGDDLVVFDIGRNYRLVVRVDYVTKVVWVDRFGTHDEYMRWKL